MVVGDGHRGILRLVGRQIRFPATVRVRRARRTAFDDLGPRLQVMHRCYAELSGSVIIIATATSRERGLLSILEFRAIAKKVWPPLM